MHSFIVVAFEVSAGLPLTLTNSPKLTDASLFHKKVYIILSVPPCLGVRGNPDYLFKGILCMTFFV